MRNAGIDEAKATGLLAGLPVTSPALARSFDRILARQTAPNFPVGLAAKDIGYLLDDEPAAPVLQAVLAHLQRADQEADVVALAMP